MLNVCKGVMNANIYAKEIKKIIKENKLQTLGISFFIPSEVTTIGGGVRARAQVFGNHGTVRAQDSLGNTKWTWGPYWRWSHHPDKTREYFTAIGFHGRYPEAVFKDWVRKLGMDFVWLTQPFGWPPCVFIFYCLLIIQLFPWYCLVCIHFTFIFTKFAH